MLLAILVTTLLAQPLRFAILGDRTGEAQPGVYEQVWKEAVAAGPAFVLSVGDTIQGLRDASTREEWEMFQRIVAPYRRFPLYLAPGNHDIWSRASEQVFRKFTGRDPHFSFDHGPVHVTVLDNSRTEGLAAAELRFLENDLKAQRGRPVKLIVSHRPSWLLEAAFRNPDFALHRLAKQYGVSHVIAGHVHQMLRFELEGIEYLSMPSAGGHLRASHKYKDGWFFGYSLVEVRQGKAVFQIHELKPPHGEGRVTRTDEWGAAGLK